ADILALICLEREASAWSTAASNVWLLIGAFRTTEYCFLVCFISATAAFTTTGRILVFLFTRLLTVSASDKPTRIRSQSRLSALSSSADVATVVGRYPTPRKVASTGTPTSALAKSDAGLV